MGIYSPILVLLIHKIIFFIFSKFDKNKDFEYHVALVASGEIVVPAFHGVWCRKDSGVRYATEGEKQQLFDALAKEGKAWDAEKKQVVDLEPKVELKPFVNDIISKLTEVIEILKEYEKKV